MRQDAANARKTVAGARVLWTVMPTANAGVVVGYLKFYANSNPTSSYIRYWCVVIDKCLMVYKSRGDTKQPRENISLSECHFSVSDKEMIRIHRVTDKKVWFCMGPSVHKRHDWVSWIRHACGA